MKAADPALIALLNDVASGETTAAFCEFDLYSITLAGGSTVLRYTTADFDINCGTGTNYQGLAQPSGVYASGGVRVDLPPKAGKSQAQWKIGLDSNQWTVVMMPRPFDLVTDAAFPDTIGSVPFLEAVRSGALAAADFQVDRAYFASVPTWPMPPGGAAPLATLTIFAGLVAEVDTTDIAAVLTVNDYLSLADKDLPRNFFQGMCRHMLFDAGCNANGNMNRAAFAVSGVAGAGSSPLLILAPGLATPAGSKTYALGTLQMTSGRNAGIWRQIVMWDGGAMLSLRIPLPYAVAPGDTFVAYPGCRKTVKDCTAFGNLPQFGGQRKIPAPEVTVAGN
jgi:hypothetical protein